MAVGPIGIPERGRTLIQPTAGVRAETETANMWGRLAGFAQEVGQVAADEYRREQLARIAGEVAIHDLDALKKANEIAAKYPLDPDGFNNEFEQYKQGVIGEAEPELIPHIRKQLDERQASMFQTLAGERRVQARQNAEQAYRSRLTMAETEALTMAGRGDNQQAMGALKTYADVVDAGVAAGFYAAEQAQELKTGLLGRATGERVLADVDATFKALDATAARRYITEQLGDGSALPVPPKEREALRNRAEARLRDLENEATASVLDWAGAQDSMAAYSALQGGKAPADVMSTYNRLSQEGKVKARRELLSAAAQASQIEDRQERRARQARERESNALILGILDREPSDPEAAQQTAQDVSRLRALGEVSPEQYRQLVQQRRGGGVDDPELLATVEDQIERGITTNAGDLLRYAGQGMSFDSIRRLTTKLNEMTNRQYSRALDRLRAEAGLAQDSMFATNEQNTKLSRMRLAFDDALAVERQAARDAGKPDPDPVAVARRVAAEDAAKATQVSSSPLQMQYTKTIDSAVQKVTQARAKDPDGNVVVIDFNEPEDIEAAEMLVGPDGGKLFTRTELDNLRRAIEGRRK